MEYSYIVTNVKNIPDILELWDSPFWYDIPSAEIAYFRPESSSHHPLTEIKLVYNMSGICGLFRVRDNFIRCIHTGTHSAVCKDSCVEFFVQPDKAPGYFNFEFNCGGNSLVSYITDPTRIKDGFKEFTYLTNEECAKIDVLHSLPNIIEPEIKNETEWYIQFFIPWSILEPYVGKLQPVKGDAWKANFYKCADETSHPHWGAWAPVNELNFHLPRCFGLLRFG
jgi:hypothetical protein